MTDAPTPFDRIGGADAVRGIASRFYALIDRDPAYAELRAVHGPDLAPIEESLAAFLTGWLGGPRDWFDARPGACIMRMHRALAFPRPLATQWADAMFRAIRADSAIDPIVGAQIAETLGRIAHAMVARAEEPAA